MTVDVSPERVDDEFMWDIFARSVAEDTGARIGENKILPTDPRLTSFAHGVAVPTFRALGATVSIDALNNVVGRFGPDSGTELLLVVYPALHHSNEMESPLVSRRAEGPGGERWIGLGSTQGKGGFAAACAAVRLLQEQGVDLAGRLTLAACSEGSSSHVSSRELYQGFERLPLGAVLMVGTENRITLGNRGRVDIVVSIDGDAVHSSVPESGRNPIPVVGEVMTRIARIRLPGGRHAQLGSRTLTPYKLVCGPVAPHTIPTRCTLVLDRRTLTGDDEEAAVAEIADALNDLPVSVERGSSMLPALVDASSPVVSLLQEGARTALGRELATFYPPYTFDAGYGCSIGVPSVMFGPSSPELDAGILGEDSVLLQDLRDASGVYAGALLAQHAHV
jgi:acetylornithine deacetylase/succinyl-diaminopimelate desuccinylase-like protein